MEKSRPGARGSYIEIGDLRDALDIYGAYGGLDAAATAPEADHSTAASSVYGEASLGPLPGSSVYGEASLGPLPDINVYGEASLGSLPDINVYEYGTKPLGSLPDSSMYSEASLGSLPGSSACGEALTQPGPPARRTASNISIQSLVMESQM